MKVQQVKNGEIIVIYKNISILKNKLKILFNNKNKI